MSATKLTTTPAMKCRHCNTALSHLFVDLGYAPPSNAYLEPEDLSRPEVTYPLRVWVCDACFLVQTEDYARANELFAKDYAYFSSTSQMWLDHAKRYCDKVTQEFGLNANSMVMEVASNDGYLLKNFVAAGIPCLGIEPTTSTAQAARKLGVPSVEKFFGEALAHELGTQYPKADLVIGNNVFAHVPDINDFALGLAAVLAPEGVVTLEFPHLQQLMQHVQFDTIYHEHYSYLSLHTVQRILAQAQLKIWHVEKLPTHGGSLRIFACNPNAKHATQASVDAVLAEEKAAGLMSLSSYTQFSEQVIQVKNRLLDFLIQARLQGKTVAAYGAAAKGNTFMNFAGIKPDLVSFVCDAAVAKQGKYMPGSHVPILPPHAIYDHKPDIIWILPWNIADEVMQQNKAAREWGAQFLTALPEPRLS